MRICFVHDWHAEKMGYIDNCLPKALAKLGHEVILLSSDLQPYFYLPNYDDLYGDFLGPSQVPVGTKVIDGVTIERLPHRLLGSRIFIRGLYKRLKTWQPDVIQTFTLLSYPTLTSAWYSRSKSCRLFTGCHMHKSVFPLALEPCNHVLRAKNWLNAVSRGKLVDSVMQMCYAIAEDTAEVAINFYGASANKVIVRELCVDTDHFSPIATAEQLQKRASLRKELGFSEADVVCVYSGRFSKSKNPMCLAKALDICHSRNPKCNLKGLFIGSGSKEDTDYIRACAGCIIMDFQPFTDLPDYYRASDIGVWPREESTSMLDANACGLPIIISDEVKSSQRIGENSLTYRDSDFEDLANQLEALLSKDVRKRKGQAGVEKVKANFSWLAEAKRREVEYGRDMH